MRKIIGNKKGNLGERFALNHYLAQGYRLVASNLFNHKGKRLGEIDLIVRKGHDLAFVEVKLRKEGAKVSPLDSVDWFKIRNLHNTVRWFLATYKSFRALRPRIDICAIEYSELDKSLKNLIIITNAVELPD